MTSGDFIHSFNHRQYVITSRWEAIPERLREHLQVSLDAKEISSYECISGEIQFTVTFPDGTVVEFAWNEISPI